MTKQSMIKLITDREKELEEKVDVILGTKGLNELVTDIHKLVAVRELIEILEIEHRDSPLSKAKMESRFLQLRLEKRNNAKRAAEMYGYSSDFYIMYKTEFGELLNILQDCR